MSGTNTYLLGTGSERLLIDTGQGIPSYKTILQSVLQSERCSVRTVLLTHWHRDHVGGIDQVTELSSDVIFYKHNPTNEDTDYSQILDGDKFIVEGAKVKAIYTPGHTEDHMAFYIENTGELFTGDCILGQGTTVFENLTKYLSSLQTQLNLNPNTIYPGHGPQIQGQVLARNKITEYITHRQQREREIIKVLAENDGSVSVDTIVQSIYPMYPQSLWPAAAGGVRLHLRKLKDDGKVAELDDSMWILISRQSSL